MADPTNPGQPSDDASSRGQPVNVNEATVDRVTVTRMNVNTGEIKELQADLLAKLCDCVDEQTATLGQIIKEARKDTVEAIKRGGDSTPGQGSNTSGDGIFSRMNKNLEALVAAEQGGGGDGGGGRGGFAEAEAAGKEFSVLRDETVKGRIAVEKWHKIFSEGAMTQFDENMNKANQAVFRFASNIMDIGGAVKDALSTVEGFMKVGQGGLIGLTALKDDIGAAIRENRDAMSETLPVLMNFAEEGNMLIGTMGNNLKEVSKVFRENRQALTEVAPDMLDQLPFEETNEILTRMLNMNRRAGVQASNREVIQSAQTRERLQILKDIAFATGKTVAELIKQKEVEKLTLQEMVFNGKMTQTQADNLSDMSDNLRGMGQENAVEFLRMINQEGGTAGLSRTDEGARLLALGNNRAILNEIEVLSENMKATPENAERIVDLFEQLMGVGEALSPGEIGAAVLDNPLMTQLFKVQNDAQARVNQQLASDEERAKKAAEAGEAEPTPLGMAAIRQEQLDFEKTMNDNLIAEYQKLRDQVKNNTGAGLKLATALAANTLALAGKGGGKLMGILESAGLIGAGAGATALTSVAAKKAAEAKLKGSSLERAKLETDKQADKRIKKQAGKKVGKKLLGMGAKKLALAGAGTALAGTAAAAVAVPVMTAIGTFLTAKELAEMAGADDLGSSIGLGLADLFGADATSDETKAKMEAEVRRLKEAAAERKRLRAMGKGVPQQKGVAPKSPADQATVAPSDVSMPMETQSPTENPMLAEALKHNELLTLIHEVLLRSDSHLSSINTNTTKMNTISKSGEGGSPRPVGVVKSRDKAPEPFTPLLDESPPMVGEGTFT